MQHPHTFCWLLTLLSAASLSHAHDVNALDFYGDLQRRLGEDGTFGNEKLFRFYMAPVLRKDVNGHLPANLVLQMARVKDQDALVDRRGGEQADTYPGITGRNSEDGKDEQEFVTLDEAFTSPKSLESFIYNIPLVLPLDHIFRHGPTSTPPLQKCTHDSRTWREKVITEILKTIGNPDIPAWDHCRLTQKIRKIKDLLVNVQHWHLEEESVVLSLSIVSYTAYLLTIAADYQRFETMTPEEARDNLPQLAEVLDTVNLLLVRVSQFGAILFSSSAAPQLYGKILVTPKENLEKAQAALKNLLDDINNDGNKRK